MNSICEGLWVFGLFIFVLGLVSLIVFAFLPKPPEPDLQITLQQVEFNYVGGEPQGPAVNLTGTNFITVEEPEEFEEIAWAASPLLIVQPGDQLDQNLESGWGVCSNGTLLNVAVYNRLSDVELEQGFLDWRLLVLPTEIIKSRIKSDPRLLAIKISDGCEKPREILEIIQNSEFEFADYTDFVQMNDQLSGKHSNFLPGEIIYFPAK